MGVDSAAMAKTIQELRQELAHWDAAFQAAKDGASYTIDGISVERQDMESAILPNLRRLQRAILQLEAAALGAEAPSFRVAVMRDKWM